MVELYKQYKNYVLNKFKGKYNGGGKMGRDG